ncbi:MAG: hypothetical protein KU37_09260 [Sulfuricurvum sp. PC08-66]|nr:MAG: hypothetical protein KU37_09260 [Sulfuricurvum sp. PC08-66]
MGTSKGYETPSGGDWNSLKRQIGGLLDQPEEKKKKVVSKFIKAIGGSEAFSSYSKPRSIAAGGGRSTSFKSSTARNTAQNIGSFFSDINRQGLQEATQSRGIDLNNKTLDEVKETLIDFFITPAVDSDTACASLAITTVIEELFEGILNENEIESYLSNVITTDKAEILICGFYKNYIYELFSRIFFEDRTIHTNQDDAIEVLDIVKETINTKVSTYQCSNNLASIDFSGQAGADFVQGILKEILEVLEEE